ncbi:YkgJ family cysteine cluster protein [Clostridium sp. Marseille-P2415]|uniref:YkgJ family cysteine cluster protein n=1 Tax=Clostridium sp. Marseille-P2415 TaxID=1805471 RepID=UPI0009886633|nr:YkgJ family cysteine cluster protein [Clostridium sp. Marseille-P2415]
MKREIDLKEISDGKLYGLNDMVKADCGDCKGCSACCQGMGQSVVLDPLDCFRLAENLHCTLETLLAHKLELNVVDGIVLPNLKMGGQEERCGFLDQQGRCRIHGFRPGICRLFPLGRVYEEQGFHYFLQIHECRMENRTKVKVRKWIDMPDGKRYEKFIFDWHCFLKRLEKRIEEREDQTFARDASMYVLKQFFLTPYDADQDFYDQFGKRLEASSFL